MSDYFKLSEYGVCGCPSLDGGDPVIIFFSAPWCRICMGFKKAIADQDGSIQIVYFDVSEYPDAAADYGFTGTTLPCFQVRQGGQVLASFAGGRSPGDLLRLYNQVMGVQ